jgi:acetyl-CoA C-acetyltransferase
VRKVAVVGVGMTKFGRSEKTQVEMFAEAAMDAINGSNLKPKGIQALYLGDANPALNDGQACIAPICASEIGLAGIPATLLEGACASSAIAVRDAFHWVSSGFYDIVLVAGVERMMAMGTPLATRSMNMGMHSVYESGTGLTFPGVFALMAHLYAKKYNVPLPRLKQAMYKVAIKAHKNASKNSKAHFPYTIKDRIANLQARAKEKGEPVTAWKDEMEFLRDPLANPMVADPLQVFDSCPMSDGAAAAIIADLDTARKLTSKPVLIVGVGQSSGGPLCTQKDYTVVSARTKSAKQAYEMAGLTPQDIDVCELHDCFTIAEIVATECLGFFNWGEGYEAVEKGDTEIGGKISINPSGGLKAKGHPTGATGVAQLYEITEQLRGECGSRQVEGASIGMTDTIGACLASIVNIILKKGW